MSFETARLTLNGVDVECKRTATPRYGHTVSGYGRRIPTSRMIRYNGRWRRVYVCVFGNAGTAYIGQLSEGLIVN